MIATCLIIAFVFAFALTLSKKLEVIETVRNGSKKKKDIVTEFGVPTSSFSTILKNAYEIIQRRILRDNLGIKRKRNTEFPDIEECLIKWFKQCRDTNVSISGPSMQEKAEFFVKS